MIFALYALGHVKRGLVGFRWIDFWQDDVAPFCCWCPFSSLAKNLNRNRLGVKKKILMEVENKNIFRDDKSSFDSTSLEFRSMARTRFFLLLTVFAWLNLTLWQLFWPKLWGNFSPDWEKITMRKLSFFNRLYYENITLFRSVFLVAQYSSK